MGRTATTSHNAARGSMHSHRSNRFDVAFADAGQRCSSSDRPDGWQRNTNGGSLHRKIADGRNSPERVRVPMEQMCTVGDKVTASDGPGSPGGARTFTHRPTSGRCCRRRDRAHPYAGDAGPPRPQTFVSARLAAGPRVSLQLQCSLWLLCSSSWRVRQLQGSHWPNDTARRARVRSTAVALPCLGCRAWVAGEVCTRMAATAESAYRSASDADTLEPCHVQPGAVDGQ